MASMFNNVGQTTASAHSGNGDYTLTGTGAGALPNMTTFAGASIPNSTVLPCFVRMGATDFEVGLYTYNSGTGTLARTRILRSSNSGLAVDWAAGSKSIYVGLPAELAEVLFPAAKGILVCKEVSPNAPPYHASRLLKRKAGHPLRVNGADSFDGSTADFEIEMAIASEVKTYLGAYGLADLVDAVKGWDIPFEAGWSPSWAVQDLETRVYREMVVARGFTHEGLEGKLLTVSAGQAVIFDLKKNGTTIYSTKPQFNTGSGTLTAGTLASSPTSFAAGDQLTFEVFQIGTTTKGGRMLVTMKNKLS